MASCYAFEAFDFLLLTAVSYQYLHTYIERENNNKIRISAYCGACGQELKRARSFNLSTNDLTCEEINYSHLSQVTELSSMDKVFINHHRSMLTSHFRFCSKYRLQTGTLYCGSVDIWHSWMSLCSISWYVSGYNLSDK